MSLRFVLAVAWLLPMAVLAMVLYHEFAATVPDNLETNGGMRTRMCREHIDSARTDPADALARRAIEECVMAGYISETESKTAID